MNERLGSNPRCMLLHQSLTQNSKFLVCASEIELNALRRHRRGLDNVR
jgi:hypothetical protein